MAHPVHKPTVIWKDDKMIASKGVTYTAKQKATFTFAYQKSGTFGQIHPPLHKGYI